MSSILGRFILTLVCFTTPTVADDPPKADSALIRLLKSGRIPEERQPQIVTKIGQLGSAEDLGYLFDKALDPNGFPAVVRVKALEALADAALTRKGLKPSGNLDRLEDLLRPEVSLETKMPAIRLAGLWKLDSAAPALSRIVHAETVDDATMIVTLDSLVALNELGRPAIEAMSAPDRPEKIRMFGIAALAKISTETAAIKAAELIRDANKVQDFTRLIAAFLDRQDGASILATAIDAAKLPADNAKFALRACYALGRADAPLITSLSKAAGMESDIKPPTKEEMDRLVADVASKGNAERGEQIFRRADLNCMKCHSIAGAAGGVGPELSPIGLTSPVDYVINSILLPDQAIKEQYQTRVVATNNGQIFQGIVTDKDESKIVLKQATGELKIIPTSEIEESKEGGSLMPKGLANLLTRDEFLDLVKFISELGKPGRYAIRSMPTIQRWQLMKTVPDDLTKAVPDVGEFVSKIRDSDPSVWVSVYGLSTGEVPVTEFAQLAGSQIVYVKGEIDVSSAGELDVDLGSTLGVNAWFDDAIAEPPGGRRRRWKVTPGRHTITLRIDTTEKKLVPVTLGISKAAGSSAEFTVVGGR